MTYTIDLQRKKASINFHPGPASLPDTVKKAMVRSFDDWCGTGMAMLECSHRNKYFHEWVAQTDNKLRQLLKIPDNYHVLFLSGGARVQYDMIPINFLSHPTSCASYIISGHWSKVAADAAEKSGKINRVEYKNITHDSAAKQIKQSRYVHYVSNETINGIEIKQPISVSPPLIVDMSSNILMKSINISDYDMIYACAQKNISIAGMSLVIIKDEMLAQAYENIPASFSYKVHAVNNSMYSTPPTFAWYAAGLMFDWIIEQGGVAEMQHRSMIKSKMLYTCIDESRMYINTVENCKRSDVNVVFKLANPILEQEFLAAANTQGIYGIQGHPVIGGVRVSLYNAVNISDVTKLIEFMRKFARES